MNKEQLIETLNLKGWSVECERNYAWFRIKIEKEINMFEFGLFETDFDYKLLIRNIGKDMIEETEFQIILQFFQQKKEDKPLLLILPSNSLNMTREYAIETYIKNKNYKKMNVDDQMVEALKVTEHVCLYAKDETIKQMKQFTVIFTALKNLLQTNYNQTLFFDYNENDLARRKSLEFFVNINYCVVSVKITIEENIIFLSLYKEGIVKEKWEIKQEQDVQTYLQSYIDKVEQNQRVRNLFQTHTYFFDKYCALNGVISFFSRRMYETLLTTYDSKEIERIAALHCKEKEPKKRIENNMKYICFFDQKALLVSRTELTVTFIEDLREINKHIKEIEKNIC